MPNPQRFRNIVTKDIQVQNDLNLPGDAKFTLGGVQFTAGAKGIGETFYVDPVAGNDAFDGKSAGAAKLTSQAAIDLCVDRRMDTIIRLDGSEVLTTPILFNKKGVSYIGEKSGWDTFDKGERFVAYGPADAAAAIISQPTHIEGVGFTTSGYVGAASHIVRIDTTGYDGWIGSYISIVGCRFMGWGYAPDYALYLKGGVACLIAGNHFDGTFYGFTDAAIGLGTGGAPVYDTNIIGNKFTNMGAGNYAIECMVATELQNNLIASNYLLGGAAGPAAMGAFFNHLGASPIDTLIADNYIPLAVGAAYSHSVGDLQTAGYLLVNNHYSE